MRIGLFASILLHLAIVGAAFISLPASWRPNVEPEPYIPLDLIRQAELDLKTSVPAAAPEPEPEPVEEPDLPEPEVEPPPAPTEEPEPAVEEPELEPEPAPVQAEIKPAPKPEPPKETPTVKPERKTAELDLDALSKLIDKERESERSAEPRETPSQPTETADRPRAAVGAGDRLTADIRAKMQAAVRPCWSVGSTLGAPDSETLVVDLEIDLNRDGSLASQPRVTNAMQINLSGNRFWKVAEQNAIRAVISCAPYDFLPQDQYETWKRMSLSLNPADMVGR